MGTFAQHASVQAIAKSVLADLALTLTPSDTEQTIAERATQLLSGRGAPDTWYYNCPALVLLGSRNSLFVSGRHYLPNDEPLGTSNLVSVDLSPVIDGVWGDCARSFFIEDGTYTESPSNPEFRAGLLAERSLHKSMVEFARPTTTFGELASFAMTELARLGFDNLDPDCFGHSIEDHRDSRIYIEPGIDVPLGSVAFFTFEPHVRKVGGYHGFKHEDIYYFDGSGRAHAL